VKPLRVTNRLETAYKAEMGTSRAKQIDAFLRQGGVVVAASERAARAVAQDYHALRRTENSTAWPAPPVFSWQSFIRTEWESRGRDGRMVLSPEQEALVWRTAMQGSSASRVLLPSSSRRLASLAMNAHGLLANFAPGYLKAKARRDWRFDSGEFSKWLEHFDLICQDQELLSAQRLAGELCAIVRRSQESCPPILLVGFDRLTTAQRSLLEAWGDVQMAKPSGHDDRSSYFAAPDDSTEVSACAQWAKQHLTEDPQRRLMIIAINANQSRGKIERSFLDAGVGKEIEFSLGVPLASVGLVRSAILTLDLLDGSLNEAELDWLIYTGHLSQGPASTAALQHTMRRIRRAGMERAEWKLEAFCRHAEKNGAKEWSDRMLRAQKLLAQQSGKRAPLEWAAFTTRLLTASGWPGGIPLTSSEFQAQDAFERQVEIAGSLGFDGTLFTWREFFDELTGLTRDSLFSPESAGRRILVAGPAESAGIEADAIWFLGADEDSWPARGDSHPLLPISVQRESEMPHASAQLDLQLARIMTARLRSSSPEITFSYSQQIGGIDKRPSRLAEEVAGAAGNLPGSLQAPGRPLSRLDYIKDVDRVPLAVASNQMRVNSATISAQSQCPFKAFATARLAARHQHPADVALSPAIRGELLHDVLAHVWSGPPTGIRTAAELRQISDLSAFVAPHASAAMQRIPAELRSTMPAPYLTLEERRLASLVRDWLSYERQRADFQVMEIEQETEPVIEGLTLRLRLDRVDQLNDGSVLVIDYKTGDVTPKSWELPRPEDLQLPLYAEFGVDASQRIGGISYARLRPGDVCFSGRVEDPDKTIGRVPNDSSLRRNRLTYDLLVAWRRKIEEMARNFVHGHAAVDPREANKTCVRCGLQTVCRVSQPGNDLDEVAEATA
jgi:probable DNA repair protein